MKFNLTAPFASLVHKKSETPPPPQSGQASASTMPEMPASSGPSEAHVKADKSAKKRFLHFLGKKPKPAEESNFRAGLEDDKDFQQKLLKLQGLDSRTAGLHGDGTQTDHLQSRPDTPPQATGMANETPNADEITATDEVASATLEETADLRTPHEVAQRILDQVKQTMIDNITAEVMQDVMAELMESMEHDVDTASAEHIWARITAEFTNALQEIAHDTLEGAGDSVTDDVQEHLDAGSQQMVQAVLEHMVEQVTPANHEITEEDVEPEGEVHGPQTQLEAQQARLNALKQRAGVPDSGAEAPQATLGELEARIGALKNPGGADATAAAPATPAASCVIDPKTHEIRQDNLKTLAADLGGYVQNMSGLLGQDTVAALKEGLELLTEVSGKKIAPGESSHGGVGLDARDCYKNLAQVCSKESQGAPAEKREALLTLRALFDELKRHHLASAATPIFKEYAAAELEKMKRDNVGITDIRAGASLVNTGEQKIGVKVGVKPAQTEFELKRERKAEVKIDDDNDIMATDTTHYSVGIAGTIKKIFNLKGTGKLTLGGGYRKLGNVPNLLKVLGADAANHRSKIHSLMIGNSAGPEARARDRKYQQGFKIANAHLLHNEAIAPRYLSSDKIAKGAHNTAAIHAAAELLDQGPGAPGAGGKTLDQILKAAYPALADLPGTPTSAMDYIPLPALSSGSTLRGPETKTTITGVEVGLEGKVQIPKTNFLKDAFNGKLKVFKPHSHDKKTDGSGLSGFTEVSGSVKVRRVENALERLKPLHTMITTGYTKDMRISLNLLGTLEDAAEKNDTATNQRINAKLALYHDLNQAFQPVIDSSLPSHDINFFGPEIDVPPTYLGTVRAPKEKWSELLDSVTSACDELQGVYDRFEEAAGTLHIENRNRDPQALKEKYTELQNTAALDILGSVWKQGYPGVSLGEDGQPQTQSLFTDSTKRREFIADTHDTISTSLASMGTHLEILKAKILKEVDANPGALDTDPALAGVLDKVKQANAKYTSLGKAIEAGNIPISKNELYRYNSLAWAKVNVKNELEVQVGVKAGAKWKMATFIYEQLTHKTTGIIADLNNSAAAMGLTLGFKFTNQDHPNFSRKGDFLEFSVTGGAGNPAAGALVEKFMREVAKLMYGGPDKFADTEGPGRLAEMVKHVASAGLIDTTQEAQLTWRLHKYSEVDDSEFEFQSFKVSQKRKESFGATMTIPATAEVAVELGAKVGQETLVPVFEYTGRDIGHHIINYAPIDKLLKAADGEQKKLPDSAHAHLKTLLDKEENISLKTMLFGTNVIAEMVAESAETAAQEDISLPDHATLAAAKQALDGKTTEERAQHFLNTQEGRTIFDAYIRSSNLAGVDTLMAQAEAQFAAQPKDKLAQTREMLDKDPYLKSQFFSSNGIVDLVTDYEAFKNNRGDPTKRSNFSFFHSKKVEESARASREADAAAAGKDLKTAIPTPLNQEVINVPDREVLTAAQEHMKGMKESERADYLLNTEEGRAIFNAYTKVVSTYKDITGSATTNLSYAPYIRQEEQSGLAQGITRPLNTAKNALLAASPFSGGVAGGDRQAEQFLNGRGMFVEDKRQDMLLVMDERERQGVPDEEVRMQSESWLAQHRIVAADNKMSGTTSLIVSYLQQVTGNYGKLYMREAEKYLSGLGLQNGAHPTQAEMEQVIQAINKDYGKSGGVRMVTPGVDGHPVWTGNVEQQGGSQDFAVIMRDRNEKGEATFSALLHKGDPGFDGFQSRKSADRMMNRLDQRQKAQQRVTDPESNLTGNMLRSEMDLIEGKGRAGKLAKAATTTIADLRRPVRKELRDKNDSDLAAWIEQAEQEGGRQRDVDEGRKEQASRAQKKASVTPPPTHTRFGDFVTARS